MVLGKKSYGFHLVMNHHASSAWSASSISILMRQVSILEPNIFLRPLSMSHGTKRASMGNYKQPQRIATAFLSRDRDRCRGCSGSVACQKRVCVWLTWLLRCKSDLRMPAATLPLPVLWLPRLLHRRSTNRSMKANDGSRMVSLSGARYWYSYN